MQLAQRAIHHPTKTADTGGIFFRSTLSGMAPCQRSCVDRLTTGQVIGETIEEQTLETLHLIEQLIIVAGGDRTTSSNVPFTWPTSASSIVSIGPTVSSLKDARCPPVQPWDPNCPGSRLRLTPLPTFRLQSRSSINMPLETIGVVGLGLLAEESQQHSSLTDFAQLRTITFRCTGACAFSRSRRPQRNCWHGWITRHQADENLSLLRVADHLDALNTCDFVIESIVEDIDHKAALFDELESLLPPETVIGTNTSALPITLIQQGRTHPGRFVGMHWGEPCHISRFQELVRGEQTTDVTFTLAKELSIACGKEPSLVQKDVRGFIANRLMYAMLREALHLLESGVADVETIDRSFRNDMGFWATIAGPFRWMDLTGIPAYASVMKDLFHNWPTRHNCRTRCSACLTLMPMA